MDKNLVKQDINFLEYPLYGLNERTKKQDIVIALDGKSYELRVGYKTPNSTDVLFLYYFIKILQDNNYTERKLVLKKSEIIKNVTSNRGSYYYKKLEDTLDVWRNVGMKFKGAFYDGKEYQTMVFGVLNEGKINKNGDVYIEFNDTFTTILENTDFYRYIDFNELKKLRRPVSRRLYEILKKSKLPLKIEIKKLAQKLTLDRKYSSQIIIKLEPAVNEINKNTDFDILFSYEKNETGKTICVFEKMAANNSFATEKKSEEFNIPPEILKSLPQEYQIKSIYYLIAPYFDNLDFLVSNIEYANKNCDKNYPAYLKLALKNDYAKVNREVKEKKDKIVQDKKDHILEKKNQEKLLKQKAWDYYNSLPEGDQFKFRSEAEEKMSAALKFIKIPEGRKDIINAQIEKDMIVKLELVREI